MSQRWWGPSSDGRYVPYNHWGGSNARNVRAEERDAWLASGSRLNFQQWKEQEKNSDLAATVAHMVMNNLRRDQPSASSVPPVQQPVPVQYGPIGTPMTPAPQAQAAMPVYQPQPPVPMTPPPGYVAPEGAPQGVPLQTPAPQFPPTLPAQQQGVPQQIPAAQQGYPPHIPAAQLPPQIPPPQQGIPPQQGYGPPLPQQGYGPPVPPPPSAGPTIQAPWSDFRAVLGELGNAEAEVSALRQELQLSEEQHAKTQNAFNALQSSSKPWINLPNWQKKNFQDWQWYKGKGELISYQTHEKLKASEASLKEEYAELYKTSENQVATATQECNGHKLAAEKAEQSEKTLVEELAVLQKNNQADIACLREELQQAEQRLRVMPEIEQAEADRLLATEMQSEQALAEQALGSKPAPAV